jgi:hypothetical protein
MYISTRSYSFYSENRFPLKRSLNDYTILVFSECGVVDMRINITILPQDMLHDELLGIEEKNSFHSEIFIKLFF